jgi:uncharacterized protein (TIGR02147 family)
METHMYLSTSDLIRDKFKEIKDANPSFSIRSWSQQMGFKSHGSLQQIISSGRAVPKKFVPLIIESLKMSPSEAQYFQVLIDFEKAKTQEDKAYFHSKLTEIYPKDNEVKFIETQKYKFYQDPLHDIILCLMDRQDFSQDAKWIKSQLKIQVGLKDIEETIERLIMLGLVDNKDGELTKIKPARLSKKDAPAAAVLDSLTKICILGSQELKTQKESEREFKSLSLNIRPGSLAQAQARLEQLIKQFQEEFEAEAKTSTETFNLNVQLFSLTHIDAK